MASRRFSIPSTAALLAFEAVARLRGFGRAAAELNTSQSAISRHIRNLEDRLGAQLFDRSATRTRLTRKGQAFFASVSTALSDLDSAARQVAGSDHEVTLACTHEVSHLILMPRYEALSQGLGPKAHLRILTTEYDLIPAAIDTGADIVIDYSPPRDGSQAMRICPERVIPVGTPQVIAAARTALTAGTPPPILDLRKPNQGWLSWSDWIAAHPVAHHWQPHQSHDNYVYMLEAAVRGAGLALGWEGFIDRYLADGVLEVLDDLWLDRGTALTAHLTQSGATNPHAHSCLSLLGQLP